MSHTLSFSHTQVTNWCANVQHFQMSSFICCLTVAILIPDKEKGKKGFSVPSWYLHILTFSNHPLVHITKKIEDESEILLYQLKKIYCI